MRLVIDPFVDWGKLMQGGQFHTAGKVFAIGYLVLFFPTVAKMLF